VPCQYIIVLAPLVGRPPAYINSRRELTSAHIWQGCPSDERSDSVRHSLPTFLARYILFTIDIETRARTWATVWR
jgi:hypothetical protein